MKNKLDFRVSSAIIKENIKQNWYLPLLMFIFLFLIGPFDYMMTKNKEIIQYSTISFLSSFSIGQAFFYILFTIMVSLIMMSYLHKKNKSLMMHAGPFTRRKIYNSNVLTGLIFFILPIILIAIIYLLLLKGQPIEIYNIKNIIYYIASSVSIIVFYYGIFILSGVLTGSTFIQLILGCAINIVVPLTTFAIEAWKEGFLSGYVQKDIIENIYVYCSPYTTIFKYDGLKLSSFIMYFVIGLLFLLLGNILTGFIKLEKTNDTLFFKVVERAITFLICFYAMSLFAFLFALVIDNNHIYLMLALGMIVGIVLAFFITEIIMNKSIKIFNKENGKFLAIILIFAIIFYLLIVCDVFGFAKRIPQEERIQSVDLTSIAFNYPSSFINDNTSLIFTDEDIIKDVIELNKEINNRDKKDDNTFDSRFDITNENIQFDYFLNNGKHIKKSFNIVIKKNDTIVSYIDKIISSDKYKEQLLLSDDFIDSVTNMTLQPAKIINYPNSAFNDAYIEYTEELVLELNKEQIKSFVDAYNEDMKALDYSDWIDYIKVHSGTDSALGMLQYEIDNSTHYFYIQDYYEHMTEFVLDNMIVFN